MTPDPAAPSLADRLDKYSMGTIAHEAAAELRRLQAENERLEIIIHGCGCPAPYTECPHDEPLLLGGPCCLCREPIELGFLVLDDEGNRYCEDCWQP